MLAFQLFGPGTTLSLIGLNGPQSTARRLGHVDEAHEFFAKTEDEDHAAPNPASVRFA